MFELRDQFKMQIREVEYNHSVLDLVEVLRILDAQITRAAAGKTPIITEERVGELMERAIRAIDTLISDADECHLKGYVRGMLLAAEHGENPFIA